METPDLIFTILIAIISAIFGVILGYFFLFKSTERKVEYDTQSYELITEELSEKLSQTSTFKILSGEELITSLTSTIVKIENIGYNSITRDNFTPEHPIQITAKGETKLYHANIVDMHGTDNNFDLLSVPGNKSLNDGRELILHHMNRGDGVKIRVFHSGKDDNDIAITGTLVGGNFVKKPEWKSDKAKMSPISLLSLIITYFIFVILSFVFVPTTLVASMGVAFLIVLAILAGFLIIITIIRKILVAIELWISKNITKRLPWD